MPLRRPRPVRCCPCSRPGLPENPSLLHPCLADLRWSDADSTQGRTPMLSLTSRETRTKSDHRLVQSAGYTVPQLGVAVTDLPALGFAPELDHNRLCPFGAASKTVNDSLGTRFVAHMTRFMARHELPTGATRGPKRDWQKAREREGNENILVGGGDDARHLDQPSDIETKLLAGFRVTDLTRQSADARVTAVLACRHSARGILRNPGPASADRSPRTPLQPDHRGCRQAPPAIRAIAPPA